MRVALVVMPFLAANRPSLAAGLLQASVKSKGISCECKYFNFLFSQMIGHDTYSSFVDNPTTVLGGEWAFSQAFYGQQFSSWQSYKKDVLDVPIWGVSQDKQDQIREMVSHAALFLQVAFESNNWSKYDLIGFTSTFEQTMPSLCLARMIRSSYPSVKLAFGGANFEGSMGAAYLRNFPFIDYVSTGEADTSFADLCSNLERELSTVPRGFLFRDTGNHEKKEAVATLDAPNSFVDLNRVPYPDYDDYYRVYQRSSNKPAQLPFLPLETSRGCWWGERHHCTFCGLNGDGMKFRRKEWNRVVTELDYMTERYEFCIVQYTDNILAMPFFKDLLPYWAAKRDRNKKFFELKSNLTRPQVEVLKAAGVYSVQAGVESLADSSLNLMRKGVLGAQNIALLRWCAELQIHAHWNVIFGFPLEDKQDYQHNLNGMRLITHLNPPDVCALIRLDRFSPNYFDSSRMGFTTVRPLPAYGHIFPFSDEDLAEVAYYFVYEHPRLDEVIEASLPLIEFREQWTNKLQSAECGELSVKPRLGGGFVLVDSRFNFNHRTAVLSPSEICVLLACDSPVKLSAVADRAKMFCSQLSSSEIYSSLSRLQSQSIVGQFGEHFVTLALLTQDVRTKYVAHQQHQTNLQETQTCQTVSIC